MYVTGRLCETDIDDCADEPCQHDGTCDDHLNGFTCRCLPGFTGKLCSETVSSPSNVTNSTYLFYFDDQPSSQASCLGYTLSPLACVLFWDGLRYVVSRTILQRRRSAWSSFCVLLLYQFSLCVSCLSSCTVSDWSFPVVDPDMEQFAL